MLPLHLGVLHKRFETVRLLLDMGADPNACGQEFTGNNRKDLLKRNKAFAEKVAQVAADAAQAATSNPYERLWHTRALGLMALVSKVKRFILSLDFSFRPHPHVSALHLAARLGNAPLLFLLVKRGAQLNGAGAAAFAPKSPLEEALQYARSNAQVQLYFICPFVLFSTPLCVYDIQDICSCLSSGESSSLTSFPLLCHWPAWPA